MLYGLAKGATVFAGSQVIEAGGTTSNTTVSGGGYQDIESGGTAKATTVESGGSHVVYSGGAVIDTTINAGGSAIVFSGGTVISPTINAGNLELAAGASVGGTALNFAGTGGTLRIDGTSMPGSVLSGFTGGDIIDLAGVPYSSAGTSQLLSNNQLQITENGQSYLLQLDRNQTYSAFRLSSDGAEWDGHSAARAGHQPNLGPKRQLCSSGVQGGRLLCGAIP
jgi:autotransporter passenger strand-loop-strand repeat protein